jgi:FAD/FMN-containing dehydrogenase
MDGIVGLYALPLIYVVYVGVAEAAEPSRSARRRDDATTRPPRELGGRVDNEPATGRERVELRRDARKEQAT